MMGQLFGNDGSKIGSEMMIKNYSSYYVYLSDMIISNENDIYITWYGYSPIDNYGISIAKFNVSLSKVWEVYPNKYRFSSQDQSTLSISTSGQLALVWNSRSDGGFSGAITLMFLNNCPAKYFFLSNYQCTSCPENCTLGCSSADQCLLECDVSCNGCTASAFDCDSCADGYFPLSENTRSCKKNPSGYFLNSTTNQYEACDSKCLECANEKTNCTYCNDVLGFFLYTSDAGSTCISNTTPGYAFDILKGTAMLCDISCKVCKFFANKCTTCATNYYPLETDLSSCKNVTPDGFYLDMSSSRYLKCDVSCINCDTARAFCIACNTAGSYFPLIDKPNTCISSSTGRSGYYYDSTDKNFKLCDSTVCATCSGSPTNCLTCSTNYAFVIDISGLCIDKSLLSYYSDSTKKNYYYFLTNNRYEVCDVSCLDCKTSSTYCLNCNLAGNYFPVNDNPNSCKSSTAPGYLFDANNNVVYKCDIKCSTCSTTIDNCTACNQSSGYYGIVDNPANVCINTAPEGYFLNSLSKRYEKCDISCKACVNSNTYCTTCNLESNYFPFADNINKCLDSTSEPLGYFFLDSKYYKCNVSCKTCMDLATNCTACNTSGSYFPLVDQSNSCISSTTGKAGYFLDNTDKIFKMCESLCATCSSDPTYCLTCSANYAFPIDIAGLCIEKSLLSYYSDNKKTYYYYNSTTIKYEKCDVSCLGCQTSSTYCLNCNTAGNYFPVKDSPNSCKSSSTPGYLFDANNSLVIKCEIQCLTCSTAISNCLTCNEASGYFGIVDNPNACYNTSPEGYFLNSTSKKHEKCDIGCKTCINSKSYCTACNQVLNYFPFSENINQCFDTTSEALGYFLLDSKYYKCDISCKTCVNSATNCTACNQGASYFSLSDNPNTCVIKLIEGYFWKASESIFGKCDVSCKSCIDSEKKCVLCNEAQNYYKKGENSFDCVNANPPAFYFDTARKLYLPCDISCASCVDTPSKCTLCSPGYSFHEEIPYLCQNSIPSNYYLEVATNTIKKCGITCKECVDKPDYCTECNYNNSYFPLADNLNKCLNACPDYYWTDFLKKQYVKCHSTCKKCNDSFPVCKECAPAHYPKSDDPTACFKEAPSVNYTFDPSNINWYLCPFPGLICNADKSFRICADEYFLHPPTKDCLKECPLGFWPNKELKQCVKCLMPCKNCLSPKKCLDCVENFYLNLLIKDENNFNCVAKCPDYYFEDKISSTCKPCYSNCIRCISETDCVECGNNLYLQTENKQCAKSCSDNYYFPSWSRVCLKCDNDCKTCTNSSSQCVSCYQDFYLDKRSNTCNSVCPKGSYAEIATNTCNVCHATCLTCKGPLENDCLSCDLAKDLKFSGGMCKGKCKANSKDCLDITECFDVIILNIPKTFFIQGENFKGSLSYNVKESCNKIANEIINDFIVIRWRFQAIENATFANENKSFEIAQSFLSDSKLDFFVDFLYKSELILSFSKSTNFITPPVRINIFYYFYLKDQTIK